MRDWGSGQRVYYGPHWKDQNDRREWVRDPGDILLVSDSEHYSAVYQFRADRADRWGASAHVHRDKSGASA